ncbi:MAG: nuclease A inhibitor family protein [Aquihabitans sp.]
MAQRTPNLAGNLALALSSLVRGLTYPSESDEPFEPFWADMGTEEPFTPETFRKAAGIGPRYEIRFDPAQETFQRLIDMWTDAIAGAAGARESNEYADYVAIFTMLATLMDAAMTDLTMVRVGGEHVVHARVFLVGRVPDGRLAGLRSVSIET